MAEAKTERRPQADEKQEAAPAPAVSSRSPMFSAAGFMVAMVLAVVAGIGGFVVSGFMGGAHPEPPSTDTKGIPEAGHKITLGMVNSIYEVEYGAGSPPMYKTLNCEPVLYLVDKVDDETRAKIEKMKEQLRDQVQDLLSSRGSKFSDIIHKDAKNEIREKIKKRLNEELRNVVHDVYFNEWRFSD